MQYGFSPPISGPLATPDNLARIAVEGEAAGYGYAAISDHVVIPRDIEARYPYSDTGEFPARSRGDRYEQLTAAAFVAGKTSRLRLVTSAGPWRYVTLAGSPVAGSKSTFTSCPSGPAICTALSDTAFAFADSRRLSNCRNSSPRACFKMSAFIGITPCGVAIQPAFPSVYAMTLPIPGISCS